MNQRSCSTGVQNTINQGGGIDVEVITLVLGGSIADAPFVLKKPRKAFFILGSTTGALPTLYISFQPTGQAQSVKNGNPFDPNAAASVPAFGFAFMITFEKGIQSFYLSCQNNNNPGDVIIVATDDIAAIDLYRVA